MCRWFISLAKRKQFTAAVWKASNDIGYDAYRDFILKRGRYSSVKSVSSPFEAGQSSSSRPDSSGRKPTVKAKTASKTDPKIAPTVSLRDDHCGLFCCV